MNVSNVSCQILINIIFNKAVNIDSLIKNSPNLTYATT